MVISSRLLLVSSGHVEGLKRMTAHERDEWESLRFLRTHYQRICYAETDGSLTQTHRRRTLLIMFQKLEGAYLFLMMILGRVRARIEHLRRALGAMRTRQTEINCRLGINRGISEFSAELAFRRREERRVLEDLHETAAQIAKLGET